MKLFEIPYNCQSNWIDIYNKNKDLHQYIKFVYLPAAKEENIQHARKQFDYSLEELDKHIKLLQENNIDICILMQLGATLELIEKYINTYNIKYFCINNDDLAKQLKSKYKNKIYVILSITRAITFDELQTNKNLKYYDLINLHFYFNRKLQLIQQLPQTYKYSLLINDICYYNCKYSVKHWFNDSDNNIPCKAASVDFSRQSIINYDDLRIFNDYIECYKISGREKDTEYIFNTLRNYINGLNSDKIVNIDIYSLNNDD